MWPRRGLRRGRTTTSLTHGDEHDFGKRYFDPGARHSSTIHRKRQPRTPFHPRRCSWQHRPQIYRIDCHWTGGMHRVRCRQHSGQEAAGYEVTVEADQRQQQPNIFTKARVRHVVTGEDVSEEAMKAAIHLSESKYCSVSAMLAASGAEIETTFELVPVVEAAAVCAGGMHQDDSNTLEIVVCGRVGGLLHQRR